MKDQEKIKELKAEIHAQKVFEERYKVYRILYDTIFQVENVSYDKLFLILCQNLRKVAQAEFAALAAFNPKTKKVTLKAMDFKKKRKFNKNLLNKIIKIPPEGEIDFKTKQVQDCKNHRLCLVEFFPDSIPREMKQISRAKDCRLSCVREGELLAIGMVKLAPGKKLEMKDLVDTYLSLAGMVIQRFNNSKEIRENEQRIKDVVNNANEWIWEVDKDGLYTYSNDIVAKILGYQPSEIVGKKHFYDFFEPSEKTKLKKIAFETFKNKKPFIEFVNINLHKNGNKIILKTSGTPVLDSKGRLLGYRGADTDITEAVKSEKRIQTMLTATKAANLALTVSINKKRKIQEEIKKSEDRLQAIFESTRDGIAVLDKKGTVIKVNKAIEKISGYKEKEVLGKKLHELKFFPPTYINTIVRNFKKRISGKKVEPYVVKIIKKNGKEAYLEIRASPLIKDGVISGTVSILEDVTERINNQKNLEFFKNAVESSTDAIGMATPTGEHFYQNNSFINLFGDIGKTPAKAYVNKKDAQQVFKKIMSGKEWSGELKMYDKNNNIIDISLRAYPIKDQEGKVIGLVGVHTNITKFKSAQEELTEKDQFLNNVFDAIQEGISVLDKDLNIIHTNKTLEKMYQKQMPLSGKKCYWVYQKRKSICPWCPSIKTLKDGKKHTAVVPYPSEKNPVGWIELSSYPLLDSNKKVIGIIENVKDITSSKKAEEKLKQEEEKFERLFESANDAIFIADIKTGKIIDANKAAEKLTGYTKKQLVGMHQSKLHPPEKVKEYVKIFKKEIKKGKTTQLRAEVCTKNKKIKPVIISANAFKIGSRPVIQKIFKDLTRFYKEEEKLHQNDGSFHLAAQTAYDLIYEWSIGTDYLDWYGDIDKALGYKKGKFPRTIKGWLKQIHPDDQKRLVDAVEYQRKHGDPIEIEYRIKRKDGTWRYWLDRAIVIKDKSGRPTKQVGSCIDITDRKNTEKEILRSRDQFKKIFDDNPVIMAISTIKDGRYIDISREFLSTLGFNRKDVIGKTSKQLKLFADYKDRKAILNQIKKYGEVKNYHLKVKPKKGQPIEGLFSAEIIEYNNEKHLLTSFVPTEYTEKKFKMLAEKVISLKKQIDILHHQKK